jgi:hypothetical protein
LKRNFISEHKIQKNQIFVKCCVVGDLGQILCVRVGLIKMGFEGLLFEIDFDFFRKFVLNDFVILMVFHRENEVFWV